MDDTYVESDFREIQLIAVRVEPMSEHLKLPSTKQFILGFHMLIFLKFSTNMIHDNFITRDRFYTSHTIVIVNRNAQILSSSEMRKIIIFGLSGLSLLHHKYMLYF
jgi:hypothetical protein